MASLDDCWLWGGSVSKQTGYGHIFDKFYNGSRPAHRVVYEALVGPVPKGLMLDHLCRNKLCINPDHLEPVTNAENQRRGIAAKLNFAAVEAIRMRYAAGESQHNLANEFGLNQSTVSRIVRGQKWASL